MKPSTAILLALLFAAAPAAADRIWLTNGRVLEGQAEQLTDGRVAVHTSFGSLTISGELVDRIDRSPSLAERVAKLRATLGPRDAEGLFQLARWCAEQGAVTLARRLYQEVLAIDPDHEGARRALGYLRQQDRWLTEGEAHAERGEVLFRGRWMPAAERERLLAWETAQQLAAAEEHRQEAAWARLAAEQARLQTAAALSQPPPIYYGGDGVLYPGAYAGGVPLVAAGGLPPAFLGGHRRPPSARPAAPRQRPVPSPSPPAIRSNRGGLSAGPSSFPAPAPRSGRSRRP
jgi:tetratricopeptide (TPR) repeat protein